jgi:putative transposase
LKVRIRLEIGDILWERQENMPKKNYTTEQIISKLREVEVLISQGQTVPMVCKVIGVSEQTYYRWRKAYGGMKIDQAQRLLCRP